jgi:hypothetical protein
LDPNKTTEKSGLLPTLFSLRDQANKFRIRPVPDPQHNVHFKHYLTLEHVLYEGTVDDIGQDICSRTDHVVAEVSGVARHVLNLEDKSKLIGEYELILQMFTLFC